MSSFFDIATFYLLLSVLKADEAHFQTAWFIESLATQVLVIFIIRTRGSPFRSRPHPALWGAAISVLLLATVIPFSPVAHYLGFVPLPMSYFVVLGGVVLVYLAVAQWVKTQFYRSALAHRVDTASVAK